MQRYDIIGQADLPTSIDVLAPRVDVRTPPRPFDPIRPPLPPPAAATIPPGSSEGGGFSPDPEDRAPPVSNYRFIRPGPTYTVEMWEKLNDPNSTVVHAIPRGVEVLKFQSDVEAFGPFYRGKRRPPRGTPFTYVVYEERGRPPKRGWIASHELVVDYYNPNATTGSYASIGQAGSPYARCSGRKCSVYATRPYLARGTPQLPKNPIIDLIQGTRVRVLRRTLLPGYLPPNLASWRRWTLVQIGNIRGWVWDLGLTPEK